MRDTLFSLSSRKITFKEYSNYPPVLRDLSILVDSGIKEADVEKVILDAPSGGLLKSLRLYDIYRLEGEKDKISYTFTLKFLADDRTLTNDEVNKLQDKIVLDLNKKLKAELRK
ncbi:MAG: hypothetical protein ACHQIH_03585 [Ignavibacteria bacterium]